MIQTSRFLKIPCNKMRKLTNNQGNDKRYGGQSKLSNNIILKFFRLSSNLNYLNEGEKLLI